MPNRNYISGRGFEYKLMKEYREQGYDVFRTAGSHGPFDIIAVLPLSGSVLWIQAKRCQTRNQAHRLGVQFKQTHPWPSNKFNQLMEIYVTTTKERLKVWAH